MGSLRFFIILVTSSIIISAISIEAVIQLAHDCPNATTFTSNSTYHSNLNILLSFLSSNASLGNGDGFFNASAGQGPDVVNGLFLCRADVSTDVCIECVMDATKVIVQRCPIQKVAIVWYDECLLRYSNRFIFSTLATDPGVLLAYGGNISEPKRLNELMLTTMRQAVTQAATAPSGEKMVAARKVNFTAVQTIYTYVQCTPDLSGSDCGRCLEDMISELPKGAQGARYMSPSCNVRYELYPFYKENALPAALPPPPLVLPLPPDPDPVSEPKPNGKSGVSAVIIVAIVAAIAVTVVLILVGYSFLRRRKYNTFLEDYVGSEITTLESLQFDLATIEAATQKFSSANKLGEGGFGVVYKGTLPNGKEIAVKRLSGSTAQGVDEFKNEVVLVAKLQHRNLVRLLGFCLDGREKILIYEFVPNKSLDYFLFDPEKQGQLNWSIRYKIIGGIVRRILYLHEDSRLRVIHRDLKASNILLDEEMNSKIADFGVARIFEVDQTRARTNRIVGTYGYMAPEYVTHGQFSIKSDVFSFGVLVLEIICGKKNSSFHQTGIDENLATYVWTHWRDGTPLEVMDPTMANAYSRNEVVRCIHIGLLCVQEDPVDRPSLATVILMLNSYSVALPSPKRPAFFMRSRTSEDSLQVNSLESDQPTRRLVAQSVNEVSSTEIYPR